MGHTNTVAIISNAGFLADEIKGMLVLLRDVDKVQCYDFFDAEDFIKEETPGVIILHAAENDQNSLKLLKKIRKKDTLKSTPVILFAEFSNADFIVEAFDLGVTDILNAPLKDYELVIRVIWAIQRNEKRAVENTKREFLTKLGVIDKESGFCGAEFSLKYLETVVELAKSDKQNASLILIKPYPAVDINIDEKTLIKSLKSSVRMSDTIVPKDDFGYYIFLAKSKINGVYSVYERLASSLGPMVSIRASAVEIKDEFFDDIINVLDRTILNEPENGEITIVRAQDFSDMYAFENSAVEEKLGIAKILNENKKENDGTKPVEENQEGEIELENEEKPVPENEDEKIALGIQIMNEQVKNINKKRLKPAPKKAQTENAALDDIETDKRNLVLYKQSWAKKINLVVRPLLKKYAAQFQGEFKLLDVNLNVTPRLAFLKMEKNDIKLDFELVYDNIKTLTFNLSILALGSVIETDKLEMEVVELDWQKLDIILGTLTKEYCDYLSND